jgi:CheY-like chemotaxis protein
MSVRAAASGAEALEWVRTGEKFDVAILDRQMPDMDGQTLAVKLRVLRGRGDLHLVLLSSIGHAGLTEARGLFSATLSKPVKPSQLFDALAHFFPSAAAENAFVAPPAVAAGAVPHGERVLLAEDNSVNQKVALLMLARQGFRADLSANGQEVLAALRRQPYDIILMDVHMPEMDGLEATREIRRLRPNSPESPWIIALTANAMPGDREICLASGMNDYISKPITAGELAVALARALSARSRPD